jgi:hypothetical protein
VLQTLLEAEGLGRVMDIDKIDWVESLTRWYSLDNEDKIILTRSEVGYLLRQIKQIPK